jgi:uncharacterized coiled-coil DUF342 family protein
MADNTDLLNQIRKVIREEVTTETEPIKKQLDEHGKKLDTLLEEAGSTRTAIKTLDNKIDATKEEVDEIKKRQRPRHAD